MHRLTTRMKTRKWNKLLARSVCLERVRFGRHALPVGRGARQQSLSARRHAVGGEARDLYALVPGRFPGVGARNYHPPRQEE